MADIEDFNPNLYTLVFDLPGDDKLSAMIREAEHSPDFVRAETLEMGDPDRGQGIWFRFTVVFANESAAAWYSLRWS